MPDVSIQVDGQEFIRSRASAKLVRIDSAHAASGEATASEFYWIDKKNPDLVNVQFILDTEGANGNWDYMPRPQLIANYATAGFKPFDMDHIIDEQNSMLGMDKNYPPVRNTIYGVMTGAHLAWAKNGAALTPEELADLDKTDDMTRSDDEKIAVVATGALYRFLFPKTVSDVIDLVEAGTMAVSMERWIAKSDFMVWTGDSYEAVAKEDGESRGYFDAWAAHQTVNGKPIYRRTLSYLYGGVASTTNPANKLSRFLDGEAMAKAVACNKTLANLVVLHNAIHLAFETAPEQEHARLIEYHTDVTKAISHFLFSENSEAK